MSTTNDFFDHVQAAWKSFNAASDALNSAEAVLNEMLAATDSDAKLEGLLALRDSLPEFVEMDDIQRILHNQIALFRSRMEREIGRLKATGMYCPSEPSFPAAMLAKLFTQQVFVGDQVYFAFDEAAYEMPITGAGEIHELLRRLHGVLDRAGVEPVLYSGRRLLVARGYLAGGARISPFPPHGSCNADAIVNGTRELAEQLEALQAEACAPA